MTLLKPLGLLGLIGIIMLIIIYIIKPNFQNKFISSTFVWKMSLKYKKKSLPTSKLKDIILIICQFLIVASCAFIIAYPVKPTVTSGGGSEVVVVLDASASMQTRRDDKTRFDRAVEQAESICSQYIRDGGRVTLIRCGIENEILLNRVEAGAISSVNTVFEDLKSENGCSYGAADIDSAMTTAKELISVNPEASVYVITDNTFLSAPETVNIINVADKTEWNAAILSATSVREEGYYNIYVKVANYGKSKTMTLELNLEGVNPTESTPGESTGNGNEVTYSLDCSAGKTYTVVFCNSKFAESHLSDPENGVYYASLASCGWDVSLRSFSSANVSIVGNDEVDNYLSDNSYTLPSTSKNVLNVQYYGSLRTKFVETVLDIVKDSYYKDVWDVNLKSVQPEDTPATTGFDMYVFENYIPDSFPTDGAVFLLNPTDASKLRPLGIELSSAINFEKLTYLSTDIPDHPLLKYTQPDKFGITAFYPMKADSTFDVLLSCSGDAVMVAKKPLTDEEKEAGVSDNRKLFVFSSPISYNELAIKAEMVLFMVNAFDYYLPVTVQKSYYSVGEEVSLNCRGDRVEIGTQVFTSFPSSVKFDLPGSYQVKTVFAAKGNEKDKVVSDTVYVSSPEGESDIFAVRENLIDPYADENGNNDFIDLVFIFAAVLTGLLFAEWLLNLLQGV